MITARPQKNLKAARQYFREHLAHGDYYSEAQNVAGYWFGKGVERLGLDPAAPVGQTEFVRLCQNLHPRTAEKLTVRQRRTDRRVFYDFTIEQGVKHAVKEVKDKVKKAAKKVKKWFKKHF